MMHERIVELRKKKKLTQEELAKKIGITRSALSQYEIGTRSPDYEIVIRLADFFEVSIDYLVGKNEHKKEEDKNELILKEIVNKYNLDLTVEGTRDTLEQIIRLVLNDHSKKQ